MCHNYVWYRNSSGDDTKSIPGYESWRRRRCKSSAVWSIRGQLHDSIHAKSYLRGITMRFWLVVQAAFVRPLAHLRSSSPFITRSTSKARQCDVPRAILCLSIRGRNDEHCKNHGVAAKETIQATYFYGRKRATSVGTESAASERKTQL